MPAGFVDVFRWHRGWLSAAPIALATVVKRFSLKGADDQNFELLGSSSASLNLKGSDDQNFPLVGDP